MTYFKQAVKTVIINERTSETKEKTEKSEVNSVKTSTFIGHLEYYIQKI